MSFGVRLRVWGEFACFTRPEMKVERVSYDVMTPSAARGVLEAIYWKPQIRWVVDRIHVLAPIRFTNLRRNELPSKIPANTARQVMRAGSGVLETRADRQQRATLLLRDVNYLIEAHIELVDSREPIGKHLDSFRRRAARGQCFHRPYLGCREFAADFEPLGPGDIPPPNEDLRGERDLGFVLHDIDYRNGRTPRFFRACLRDGVIDVPPWKSSEVHS